MTDVVHYLVGDASACGRGTICTADRALVTCRRCLAYMDAGETVAREVYLPPGEQGKRRGPRMKEPKPTLAVPGLGNVVLDACSTPLKRGGYP